MILSFLIKECSTIVNFKGVIMSGNGKIFKKYSYQETVLPFPCQGEKKGEGVFNGEGSFSEEYGKYS